ncbi:MAG: hypothetical protein KZQ95_03050 [Candidatus Thiodiazotropha sp. (ex Epidulcina cf. delphinae)]|nr:hypothetical protein [Candidatus Thiodiazotropha sp. (ex Epidulcina cf. delphinae)]
MQEDGSFQLNLHGIYWCNNDKAMLVKRINSSGYKYIKSLDVESLYQVSPVEARYFKAGSEIYSNAMSKRSIILIKDWRTSRAFITSIDWCSFILYEDYFEN